MIAIRQLGIEEALKIREIDRTEIIGSIFTCKDGVLTETKAGHECPNWDEGQYAEMIERFRYELEHGGIAFGAFDQERLVGFGVLGHQFRGSEKNQLQVDLMYVSQGYRRQGIGSRIMGELSTVAREKGAAYLYISSTETESAVQFYLNCGGAVTDEVDQELFKKEPEDIHMLKKL